MFVPFFTVQSIETLLLDDFRGVRFELSSFQISTGNYSGQCDSEAIRDNIFASRSAVLRSQGGLVEGANGYFFDDLERCSSLNFAIIVIKKIDFINNELKIGLYKAIWSKEYGLKPISVDLLYGQIEITAKCNITEQGFVFKTAYLSCDLKNRDNKDIGQILFVEQ